MNRETFITLMRNKKVLLFATLFLIGIAANASFYEFGVAPATEKASDLEQQLQNTEKKVAMIKDGIARHKGFEISRSRVAEFKELLPSVSEYTQILRKTYELAKKRDVFESSISISSKTAFGEMYMLSFNLPVSGDYRDVRKFIHDVETSDLFLNIGSLSISKGSNGNVISLKIGLSTYVRS